MKMILQKLQTVKTILLDRLNKIPALILNGIGIDGDREVKTVD
jgi:hypothetical protein